MNHIGSIFVGVLFNSVSMWMPHAPWGSLMACSIVQVGAWGSSGMALASHGAKSQDITSNKLILGIYGQLLQDKCWWRSRVNSMWHLWIKPCWLVPWLFPWENENEAALGLGWLLCVMESRYHLKQANSMCLWLGASRRAGGCLFPALWIFHCKIKITEFSSSRLGPAI